MAIQFIIGRAGTGKTRHCLDAIVAMCREDPLGQPIWWIVPRQMTFLCERMLACESGLAGVCRVRIVSFDRLVEDVLAEVGGLAMPKVSPVGRQMIIGHLLRAKQDAMRFFASSARQVGLAGELSRTFDELDRCGARLPATTDLEPPPDQPPVSDPLRDKLHDLSLLYDAYRDFLGSDRLDPHLRRQRVLDSMARCPSLVGATCFVDGFHDLTAFERQAIGVLGRVCRSVVVTALLDPALASTPQPPPDPDRVAMFRRPWRAYEQLVRHLREGAVEIASPVYLRDARRFADSPALRHLEASWEHRRARGMDAAGITLHEADDRRAEVDAAASAIRQLTQSGIRYRQVAVLMRDVDAYAELIETSFRRHDIPLFIDRRRSAEHHPLVQFVRGALRCVTGDMPLDAVMAVARSGLAGIERPEADLLENYYLEHRLKPSCWLQPENWSFKVRRWRKTDDAGEDAMEERLVDAGRIDAIRRVLVQSFQPLIDAMGLAQASVCDRVRGLVGMLETANVRRTLSSWIRRAEELGQFEQRDEHRQVWSEFTELLDQLVELLGDKTLSAAQFSEIIDYGFEQFDLAITPPTVDQVLVGDVDRTRTHDIAAVLLLGMNDGEFPATPTEDTIFSDQDRRALKEQLRLELEPETPTRLRDESFLAYAAMTRPSRRLLLFRARNDDGGRPTVPSLYWRRVRALFPKIAPDSADAFPGTAAGVVSRVLRWIRSPDAASAAPQDTLSASLYTALLKQRAAPGPETNPFTRVVTLAWPALGYRNAASLSPGVARELFASPLETSVSALEAFASCSFRHFARYGLRLEPPPELDPTWLDVGNVCHAVLERLVRRYLRRLLPTLEEIGQDTLARELDAAARVVADDVLLDESRNRFLLQRVKVALEEALATQRAILQAGTLRPAAVEAEFGPGKPLQEISIDTPSGRIVLRGKIDRIDLSEDAGVFAVIDYKLTGRTLSLEQVYHGLALQLLIYLAVVRGCERLGDRVLRSPVPAAAVYVPLTRSMTNLQRDTDLVMAPLDRWQKTKPRGVLNGDEHVRVTLDAALASATNSQFFSAQVTTDGRLRLDLVAGRQLDQLVRWALKKVAELGEGILRGVIAARPTLDKWGQTPCSRCDYRDVCRFESSVGPYRELTSMKPDQVLDQIAAEMTREGH